MNERILELVNEAKQFAREQMAHTMNSELFSARVFQEKFAELIVRECAKIADEPSGRQAGYNIKKYFGVEE